MANKKIYAIEINGITESVKSVDVLTERLKALEDTVGRISKMKLTINDGNISKAVDDLNKLKNTKVGGTVDKAFDKAMKDRAKAIDKVTKELGDSKKTLKEYQEETKKLVAQEVKARNESKKYANTLNGLKAELKDLNAYKGDIDLGSDEYKAVSDRILELNNQLKEYEAQQGTFNRNVGNYTNSIKDAVNELDNLTDATRDTINGIDEIDRKFNDLGDIELDADNIKKYDISINDLETHIKRLENKLKNLNIGSDEWDRTNNKVKNLKQTLSTLSQDMEAAVRAEDRINTKIQVNVGGMKLTFDDVNQGIGILEDKLYQLASAGQRDTKQFREIADAAAELKEQVKGVDTEIDNMVEGGKGINKMLSYFKGFTAIATTAQGLGNLFGMDDKDSQKQIQTMTSLIGVLEGVKLLSEEMKKGTEFGKLISAFSQGLDKVLSLLGLFNVQTYNMKVGLSDAMAEIAKAPDSLRNLTQGFDNLTDAQKQMYHQLQANKNNVVVGLVPKLSEQFKNLNKEIVRFGGKPVNSIQDMYVAISSLKKELNQTDGDELFGKWQDFLKDMLDTASAGVTIENSGGKIMNTFRSMTGALARLLVKLKLLPKSFIASADSVTSLDANMRNAAVGARVMASGLKVLEKGIKLVKAAFKAFLVFEMIDLLIKGFAKLKDAVMGIFGNDRLVTAIGVTDAKLDHLSRTLEKTNKELDKMFTDKQLNQTQLATKRMDEYEKAMLKAFNSMKEFIKLQEDIKGKELGKNLSADELTRLPNIKDLEEFKKEYQSLIKAVESGIDQQKVKGGDWLQKLWFTKSDAKSDLGVLQKRVIQDLVDKINNIDLSKGAESVKEFFDTIDDEMYSSAIANLENLFPEEEWAQSLKKYLDFLREYLDQYNQSINESKELTRKALEDINKLIRDNLAEAIRNEDDRIKAQLRNRQADEEKAAKEMEASEAKKEELLNSIRAKYGRYFFEAERNKQDKIFKLYETYRDNNLETERNYLSKRIAVLNNSRKSELREAEKLEYNKEETILSINKKYDYLILEEKKEHNKYLDEINREYVERQIDYYYDLEKARLASESSTLEIRKTSDEQTSDRGYDVTAKYGERIAQEKEYLNVRLEILLDYQRKREEIERADVEIGYSQDIENEKRRYDTRLRELESFHAEGKLEKDEYDREIEREDKYHTDMLARLAEERQGKLNDIEGKGNNERKSIISNSLKEQANLYSRYQQEVQSIMGKRPKTNIFGMPMITDMKKRFDEATKLTREGISNIDNEMKNLDKALDRGDITFIDYKDAKQQLEKTKQELIQGGEELSKGLNDMLGQTVMGYKSMIDGWVSQIGSLLSTFNETQMILIENEINEVNRQLEIQQDAYDKAEEAANAHKDKMNEIEDELSDSRGSRRQFLIDNLLQQQQAYQEDLKAQQDAEKEKERLEKRQKALEKKRQEQEKKAKIQQAIINTFMAVSNALAVNPWFVGLALSAVALGLGMAQVNAIRGTKIYANGGVIDGPDHKHGGVKVLGGSAEVEGGEYIINKRTTRNNLPLLNYINKRERKLTRDDLDMMLMANDKSRNVNYKYASGGELPDYSNAVERVVQVVNNDDNKQYVVQVVDIINAADNIRKIETLSGLANE